MLGMLRDERRLIVALLVVVAVTALSYLVLGGMAPYLGVFFGSVLFAILINSAAERVNYRGKLPHAVSVLLVIIALLGSQAAVAVWLGPELVDQFRQLSDLVPSGLRSAREFLQSSEVGRAVLDGVTDVEQLVPSARRIFEGTGRVLGAGAEGAAKFMLFLVIGVFVALDPARYSRGAVRLLPPAHRGRALEVLGATGDALRKWLVARLLLMVLIGALFGTGLAILQIPLALPLALIAGAFSIVPYLGPALAYIPAVAVALLQGPMQAVYVTLLYSGVQLVESYVVEPLVEARAVTLPPALIIASQVIATLWLGPIGVVLATPLLVVVVVLVQMLYIEDVLHERTDIIGTRRT
jgi:predicted PurR-regulated permease PerM